MMQPARSRICLRVTGAMMAAKPSQLLDLNQHPPVPRHGHAHRVARRIAGSMRGDVLPATHLDRNAEERGSRPRPNEGIIMALPHQFLGGLAEAR